MIVVALLLAIGGPLETARETIAVAAGIRCPKAIGDEIVVCGNPREKERLRYRLPMPAVPEKGDPRNEAVFAERNRWLEFGKSGIGSGSPVGPGGESGRNLNALKQRMDRNEGTPIRF